MCLSRMYITSRNHSQPWVCSSMIIESFMTSFPFIPYHVLIHHISSPLAMRNLLHNTILTNMNIQPVRFMIHSLHAIRLQNTVFLGEIGLCECLWTTYD